VSSNKCPPQFIFEIAAAHATRLFLKDEGTAQEIVASLVLALQESYDAEDLQHDLISAIERILVFMDSVEISDIDLMLTSFIYYRCNYDDLKTKKNKKPMFGTLLKGGPKDPARAYSASKTFASYVYATGSKAAPAKPDDWSPSREVELNPVLSSLIPPLSEEELEKQKLENWVAKKIQT